MLPWTATAWRLIRLRWLECVLFNEVPRCQGVRPFQSCPHYGFQEGVLLQGEDIKENQICSSALSGSSGLWPQRNQRSLGLNTSGISGLWQGHGYCLAQGHFRRLAKKETDPLSWHLFTFNCQDSFCLLFSSALSENIFKWISRKIISQMCLPSLQSQ